MIKRYIDFLSKENYSTNETLLENVQQAKDFLRKLEVQKRKSQGIESKLTEEEVKALERDPYFIKIKEMLSQTPGLTYLFTKTFFRDWANQWEGSDLEKKRCLDELKTIYDSIKSKRDLWGLLPMTFDKYASLEPDENDTRPAIERLTDDWREVISSKNFKKYFFNRLLPFQKVWFKDATEEVMKKFYAIGDSFANFGMRNDGTIDPIDNKIKNDDFFMKDRDGVMTRDYIGRFRTIGPGGETALLTGAEDHIDTVSKSGYTEIRKNIEEANRKCGKLNGVDIIWEERGLMVVEVKSYPANKIVNSHTSHCIKDSLGMWNNYVSLEKLTRQYYLYNFNVSSADSFSVIGVTIDKNGKVTYAHKKRDENYRDSVLSYMKTNKIPVETLEPYTKEQQRDILRRVEANKILRKESISYTEILYAIEEGGDVNVDNGLPLMNAISRGDTESVNRLIDAGAMVNIRTDMIDKMKSSVPAKQNLEIVSKLITNGFEINQASYKTISKSIQGVSIFSVVKLMLESGLDPNCMVGRLLRDGIVRKDVEWVEQLSKYNLNFAARDYMVILSLLQQGDGPDTCNVGNLEVKLFDIVFSKLRDLKDTIFTDSEKRMKILQDIILNANYFVCDGEDSVKAKRIKVLLEKFEEYGGKSDKKDLIEILEEKLSKKSKNMTDEDKYIQTIIKEISK